jgi:transposase InsO family protein
LNRLRAVKQGADGVPAADICRKAGISQATYFNWKKKYDGRQPPELRRLKALEDENAKPTDSAFIEAFNGRFRAECLNVHWSQTLDDARSKMEDWRRYYNEERPHGAIGNKSPIMLQSHDGATSPPP